MGRRPTPDGHITPAEAQVLAEYARGGGLAAVAGRLYISHGTARRTLLTARRRMDADSNVHLLALAIAVGDVPAPAPAALGGDQ